MQTVDVFGKTKWRECESRTTVRSLWCLCLYGLLSVHVRHSLCHGSVKRVHVCACYKVSRNVIRWMSLCQLSDESKRASSRRTDRFWPSLASLLNENVHDFAWIGDLMRWSPFRRKSHLAKRLRLSTLDINWPPKRVSWCVACAVPCGNISTKWEYLSIWRFWLQTRMQRRKESPTRKFWRFMFSVHDLDSTVSHIYSSEVFFSFRAFSFSLSLHRPHKHTKESRQTDTHTHTHEIEIASNFQFVLVLFDLLQLSTETEKKEYEFVEFLRYSKSWVRGIEFTGQ